MNSFDVLGEVVGLAKSFIALPARILLLSQVNSPSVRVEATGF